MVFTLGKLTSSWITTLLSPIPLFLRVPPKAVKPPKHAPAPYMGRDGHLGTNSRERSGSGLGVPGVTNRRMPVRHFRLVKGHGGGHENLAPSPYFTASTLLLAIRLYQQGLIPAQD